jgi:hypothetical protein
MKCIGVVLLGWTVVAHTLLPQPHIAPPPVGGRLAAAVLLGGAPLDGLPEDLSSSDRMQLTAYRERWQSFKPLGTPRGYDESPVRRERRERLEHEIVSIIEHQDIRHVAHAIAWSEGAYAASPFDPQMEATWAEGLLRDPANAVAAPFLYAFLASRYRLQFERADENRPALERLAKKYKTMLDRVRSAGDGLFILLADDLDNRASLLPGVTRHPRQYLPDT